MSLVREMANELAVLRREYRTERRECERRLNAPAASGKKRRRGGRGGAFSFATSLIFGGQALRIDFVGGLSENEKLRQVVAEKRRKGAQDPLGLG